MGPLMAQGTWGDWRPEGLAGGPREEGRGDQGPENSVLV